MIAKRAEFINLKFSEAWFLYTSLQDMPELIWYEINHRWGVAVYRTR